MVNFTEEFDSVLEKQSRWVFASVVGSHNYGTASEYSDVDMKVMYLPTFEEFFNNKFDRTSDAGPGFDVDYTCHPFHEFVNHCFKGNSNFWEVFYSDHLRFNDRFITRENAVKFIDSMKEAVRLNYMANFWATRGMAFAKFKRFENKIHLPNPDPNGVNPTPEATPLMIDRHNKEIQHAMRLMLMMVHYVERDELRLCMPEHFARDYISLRDRTTAIDYTEGSELFKKYDAYLDTKEPILQARDEAVKFISREPLIGAINENFVFDLTRNWVHV